MRDIEFENPANGYRESVSELAFMWALMFGVFYYFATGLWVQGLVITAISAFLFGDMGQPALLFVVPIWLGSAFFAKGWLVRMYLRKGWRQV